LSHGLVVRTRDLDEAASVLSDAAIPYSSELSPGSPAFSTEVFVTRGQQVCVSRVVTRGKLRVRSMLPEDCFAVVLDLGGGAGLHCVRKQSVAVDSECALVESPLESVEVHTTPAFDILFLRIQRKALLEELVKMLNREVHRDVIFSPAMRMDTVAGRQLREISGGLRRVLYRTDEHEVEKSTALRKMESELMRLLLEAQPHNYSRLLNRCNGAGSWQIRAAEEYIRAYAHLPLTLGDICQAAGVNVRTLLHTFQKKRGHSPMDFLRGVRMEAVRAALLHPDPQTSVTREAANWGFLHFGRFAHDYRARYHELPSETLRRARKRHDAVQDKEPRPEESAS
jgi:AraC-like DNA-binding protein